MCLKLQTYLPWLQLALACYPPLLRLCTIRLSRKGWHSSLHLLLTQSFASHSPRTWTPAFSVYVVPFKAQRPTNPDYHSVLCAQTSREPVSRTRVPNLETANSRIPSSAADPFQPLGLRTGALFEIQEHSYRFLVSHVYLDQ